MIHPAIRRLVENRIFRVLQVANVPDISNRVPVLGWADGVSLVVLVVQQEVFLVQGVEHPALVGVGCTVVRSAGDDGGVSFVGDVVDGETVFVVAVADVMTKVALVGTAVFGCIGPVERERSMLVGWFLGLWEFQRGKGGCRGSGLDLHCVHNRPEHCNLVSWAWMGP